MSWESGNVAMSDVRNAVAKLKLYNIGEHHIVESTAGPLTTLDLPLLDLPNSGFIKCFLDVIMDVPSFPSTEIKQIMQSQSFMRLPKPYGLAKDLDVLFRIDLAVIPQDSGKFTVIKIINLKDKKNTVEQVRELCHRRPYAVDWSGNVITVKKSLHFLFELLGGFQCRHHVLRTEEEGKPEQERSLEEWDFGLDFIEQQGPRENVRNRLLRWVTVQTTTRDSPIYRWPQALVEKSLRNLSQDGVLAQVHEMWPLTLYDLDTRLLKALGTIFSSLTEKALGLHGTPGAGKTPVARTVAMGLSRFWITKLGKTDEITRIYCSNDFDVKTEPPLDQPLLDIEKGIATYVSHSAFMKMLENAWCSKDCNDANIMAVLKRTHIFVNTSKCLHIRPASETEGPVLRIPLGDKIDFLHVDSREVYDYHRKGGKDLPQDFDMKVNWERDWVTKAMTGDVNLPTRATIIRRGGLFQSAPSTSTDSTVEQNHRRVKDLLHQSFDADIHTAAAVSNVKEEVPNKRELETSARDRFASKTRRLAADYVGKAILVDDSPKAAKEPAIKQELVSAFSRSLSSSNIAINLVDSPEKRPPTLAASSDVKPSQDDNLERELETLMEAEFANEEAKNNDARAAEAEDFMDCCTDDENFIDTHMADDKTIIKLLIADKLLNVPQSVIHLAMGTNHKAVEDLDKRLCKLRKDFVEKEEKNIVFGNQKTWVDVEADEATFDKRDISQDAALKHLVTKKNESIMWEQWGGAIQRPGAIRKTEWNTIANELLLDRKVYLEDGLPLDFLFRCNHCIALIGQDNPVYMGHDRSYCSPQCRRRGRSTLYRNLRSIQLDSICEARRPMSESGTSGLSTAWSDSSITSSRPKADRSAGPLGWMISKVVNVISNRLPESLAVLQKSALVQSASSALLRRLRRQSEPGGSSLQRLLGYLPDVASVDSLKELPDDGEWESDLSWWISRQ
ncbi:unnamed protein product [Symbiodinium sp. CCMP2592]|nr:unnamed protein product [Symbiodinium sp. CCMP2592]